MPSVNAPVAPGTPVAAPPRRAVPRPPRPGGPGGRSRFGRLGLFAYRHPLATVAVWAVLVAAGTVGFANLSGALRQTSLGVAGSDSARAQAEIARAFPTAPDDTAFLVFTSPSATATDPAYRAVVRQVAARVASIRGVAGIVLPWQGAGMVSGDGGTAYATVALRGDNAVLLDAGRDLLAVASSARSGPVRVSVTGQSVLGAETIAAAHSDLADAERVGLPIAAIVLIAAFGTLIAASMPLAIAAAALVVGMGLLYAVAQIVDMSVLVENAASMMGIAVGIDYALLIVTRYREEVARLGDRAAAVERTMATAGRAVFLSGVTVALALAGCVLVPVSLLRVMAVGPVVVVAGAVAAALTLIPALLRLAGGWIDRLRIPGLRLWRPQRGSGFWYRWAITVMRRPVLFLVAGVAAMAAMAWPVTGIALGNPGISSTPGDFAATAAYRTLSRAFGPGVLGPVLVAVRDPAGAGSARATAAVGRFRRLVGADPRVAATTVATSGDTALVTVVPTVASDASAAGDLVARVRDRYAPAAFGGLQVHVGGPAAENLDAKRALLASIPRVYGYVLLVTFVLLFLAFASIAIPLKAIVMNLLSVGAAFGALVLVFQHGWGAGVVGVGALPYLDFITPLIVFTALFGLSMDYEVFLLSRMREHFERTGDNEAAVARGLETTGRTVTAAALIMVVVFAAFVPTRLLTIKQIGLGLAIAIALDATLVRLVLVPSMMRLLGRWNWWLPARIARRLPRLPAA